ncbi:D-Ala-D-Ala carboxypeptidase family metallohydrolase [Stenotrophomonas maltophilia]|uniref:D-Ala-D-Ala carboxypeptidase family metallohydrolase n=1 Tax=Stenotrophomonas maltophilia TaxID=40324 RepID=UPI003CF11CB4
MAFNLGGLLGGFIPESAGLSEKDRQALGRQGLLSLGLGLLRPSGGSFGGALSNGIQSGLLAVNQGAENLSDIRYKNAILANQAGGGTDFRAIEAKAKAAGYAPGSEDYRRAFRVALGTEGRASSAGYGFDQETDDKGIPRPARNDPRTGSREVYVAETGEWVPLGGGVPATGQLGQVGSDNTHFGAFNSLAMEFPNVSMTSGVRSPERNAAVGGQPNSQHLRGTAADYAVPPQLKPAFMSRARQLGYTPIDEGDHVHIQLPRGASSIPGLGRGRPKEQEAGAVAAAQAAATLPYTMAEIGAKTNAAIQQADATGQLGTRDALATAQGRNTLDAQAEAQKRQVANANSLAQYDAAIKGLKEGLAGATTNPLVGNLPAVTANQQIAQGGVAAIAPVLKQLFRAAGEGTFTDADQKLLMEMVPNRMDLPAAREAKLANIDAIVRAKLGQSTVPAQSAPAAANGAPKRRLKFNPATGKIE